MSQMRDRESKGFGDVRKDEETQRESVEKQLNPKLTMRFSEANLHCGSNPERGNMGFTPTDLKLS